MNFTIYGLDISKDMTIEACLIENGFGADDAVSFTDNFITWMDSNKSNDNQELRKSISDYMSLNSNSYSEVAPWSLDKVEQEQEQLLWKRYIEDYLNLVPLHINTVYKWNPSEPNFDKVLDETRQKTIEIFLNQTNYKKELLLEESKKHPIDFSTITTPAEFFKIIHTIIKDTHFYSTYSSEYFADENSEERMLTGLESEYWLTTNEKYVIFKDLLIKDNVANIEFQISEEYSEDMKMNLVEITFEWIWFHSQKLYDRNYQDFNIIRAVTNYNGKRFILELPIEEYKEFIENNNYKGTSYSVNEILTSEGNSEVLNQILTKNIKEETIN